MRYIEALSKKSGLSVIKLLLWANIHSSKFYAWKRSPESVENKPIPREHYILPEERRAVVEFKVKNPATGYRRLTWMMIDQDVAYVSPASVLRILTQNGLNTIWTRPGGSKKLNGFHQPSAPHSHWHTDITFVNVMGAHMFLISVLDGYSRYILHHGLYESMSGETVSSVIYGAHEKHPQAKPAVIMDNGPQFIAKEFKTMLKSRLIIISMFTIIKGFMRVSPKLKVLLQAIIFLLLAILVENLKSYYPREEKSLPEQEKKGG